LPYGFAGGLGVLPIIRMCSRPFSLRNFHCGSKGDTRPSGGGPGLAGPGPGNVFWRGTALNGPSAAMFLRSRSGSEFFRRNSPGRGSPKALLLAGVKGEGGLGVRDGFPLEYKESGDVYWVEAVRGESLRLSRLLPLANLSKERNWSDELVMVDRAEAHTGNVWVDLGRRLRFPAIVAGRR
jgi:hypothetical protein